MAELSYSFHLGSNKNRKTSSRNNAKNNLSKSSSLANNGIQNLSQLSKVNNHDFRKYDKDNQYIYQLKGTNDIVYDVKNFYKEEFEEARVEYNDKQSRPSRKIDDYFEYMNKDEKRDLACEIIIELGNKKYWDSKDFEFKRQMVNVYEFHLRDLEELVPEFKITNAVVHLDETSPHMHIVGVPVKAGCKTGLSKQVNKSSVFNKERLEHIQNVMREKCINRFNNEFEDEQAYLKKKEKGRNKDINVKDMMNYQELKKELEVNKKSIDKNNEKINKINNSSKELNDLLSNMEESRLGGYRLTSKQKERLHSLLKDVESLTNYFDNYKNIINNVSQINDNLKYQKDRNHKLENENNSLIKDNQKLKMKNTELKDTNRFVKNVMDKRMDERKDFITYLCKNVNSNNQYTSISFKKIANDMYKNNLLSDKEHRVIFNPPSIITKSEINKALHLVNRQMDEAAEEFYKINENKDDYFI